MRLTKEQEALLERLSFAKGQYNAGRVELDRQHEIAVDALKDNIRRLTDEATELGVPRRQVHLTLGFGQVGQLDRFLKPSEATGNQSEPVTPETPEKAGETPSVPQEEAAVRIAELDDVRREVYDVDGTLVLTYNWLKTDGAHVMAVVEPHLTEEPPARIKDAICAQTPKPILVKISADPLDDVEMTIWNYEE